MPVERAFYITQGSLSIWVAGRSGPERTAIFAEDQEGLYEFDSYLALAGERSSAVLVDVIEEEFTRETIPKVGFRDRQLLIDRRLSRKYRRTSYRTSILQGRAEHSDDEYNVLHAAITNTELLDPWMQIILRHQVPLRGIYSVPLIAPKLFEKIFQSSTPCLFIAPHQGNKLRQVFITDGHVASARLSQAPGMDADAFANFVVTEAERSRRYLERMRLLSNMELLSICVIADKETGNRIAELTADENATQFSCIDHDVAASRMHGAKLQDPYSFEVAYLSIVLGKRPKHSYARSGENRYWVMRQIRNSILAASAVIATACSAMAAFYFSDTWVMRDRVDAIESQVTQLTETFRRENERFNPIKAGSHEMKLAVDTGEYILRNRLPAPWVMNQVGVVLSNYPQIRIRELEWLAESPAPQQPVRQRRGNAPMPVTISEISGVGALLTADIVPFDGDMRQAFAIIDRFASDLQERTHFSRAITVEYPLNASPSAAVSGEIGIATQETARFRMRLIYDVPGDPDEEGGDEAA